MTQRLVWSVSLVLGCATGLCHAALSGNLFNGDFENVATLKNNYTYDNDNNAVGAHRFNADGPDFGKWIGIWGLQDLEQNGYYGLGGFSTHDYPRQVGATMRGVAGYLPDDISNNNRSLDPYNPGSGNHIMETVAFYPTMAQWVQAPANQTTGPMQLKFDFFLNHFDPGDWDWITRFDIRVYGSNFLPPHNVGMGTNIPGTSFNGWSPTGGATSVDTTIDGVRYQAAMLARFGWGQDWTNWDDRRGAGNEQWPETGGWVHMDSANSGSGSNWYDVDQADWGNLIIPINLTQTYQYYSVTISTMIYSEAHEYFWMVPGYGVNGYRPTDTGPAIGFDNIDFRVSVDEACAHTLGDVNLDTLVNALDISPFVSVLTSGVYQVEADINQDNLVNALDISGFVTCLVNGTCPGDPCPVFGGSAACGTVVPEPGTVGLVVLSAGALLKRVNRR